MKDKQTGETWVVGKDRFDWVSVKRSIREMKMLTFATEVSTENVSYLFLLCKQKTRSQTYLTSRIYNKFRMFFISSPFGVGICMCLHFLYTTRRTRGLRRYRIVKLFVGSFGDEEEKGRHDCNGGMRWEEACGPHVLKSRFMDG